MYKQRDKAEEDEALFWAFSRLSYLPAYVVLDMPGLGKQAGGDDEDMMGSWLHTRQHAMHDASAASSSKSQDHLLSAHHRRARANR